MEIDEDFIENLPQAGDISKRANDKEKIDVTIAFNLHSFCKIEDITLIGNYGKICGAFFNGVDKIPPNIVFFYDRKIPKSLFDDLNLMNARSIILGYISDVLPHINNELVSQKKDNNNLLFKRYSVLDILGIVVTENNGFTRKKLDWPIVVGNFPFDHKIKEIYFHDLINAIQSFFYTDYNESIRKLITSVESYMKKNKRTVIEGEKNTFKNKLNKAFSNCDSFMSTIITDIKYIYDVRNLIVHEGKTVNPDDSWFVDLAIGCVFYFYKFVAKTQEESDFFLQLEIQYTSLRNLILGQNLSDFVINKKAKVKTIENYEDINNMMEEKFKIIDDDIQNIKDNLIDNYL